MGYTWAIGAVRERFEALLGVFRLEPLPYGFRNRSLLLNFQNPCGTYLGTFSYGYETNLNIYRGKFLILSM